MKLLFLESFFGGSHGAFARGLAAHSKHDITLMTMPDRNWQWRMRGAALHFFMSVEDLSRFDGLIVTDLMGLADFKALAGTGCPPVICYFHENQMTYPGGLKKKGGYHAGMIDITTALTADHNGFNSRMHLTSFLAGIEALMTRVPDYKLDWVRDTIAAKSDVMYPGINFPEKTAAIERSPGRPPLIIWNHRWGYDKNLKAFLAALDQAVAKGLDFRLAILGEPSAAAAKNFEAIPEKYGHRLEQLGYVQEKAEYFAWLRKGDIVISTAHQENFGYAVIEAIRCGCIPLLPQRLAYPEILPERFHRDFLYLNRYDMDCKLTHMIGNLSSYHHKRLELAEAMDQFAWQQRIGSFDQTFERFFTKKTNAG